MYVNIAQLSVVSIVGHADSVWNIGFSYEYVLLLLSLSLRPNDRFDLLLNTR
jgi:hypothetical protein